MIDDDPPPEKPDEDRLALDELPKAKDAYHYVVDPRWLRQVGHWERTAPQLSHFRELPSVLREIKNHLDPDDWGTGFLKVRDYEAPWQLRADLKACTPQALLRDLFRPVMESRWHEREVQVKLDFGGREAMRQGRASLKRDPIPVVEPLTRDVEKVQKWQRTLRQEPWTPHYPDDVEHPKVSVFRSPDVLNW